ncbi:MAG: archease [Chloroflexota bacterium]|nr:archease [Chloroflexota bacterium]
MKRFEEIPHTADWSFRAFGKDLRELFENAAFAMFTMEGAQAQVDASETTRAVAVRGIDHESLLVNWLTELLWLQESNHEIYSRFQIDLRLPTALDARVFGTPIGKIDKIIKAVTYHNLKIEQTTDGWQAVVVVDV